MTAEKLESIPEVEIDPDDTFKYVLIKVYEKGASSMTEAGKLLVRGFRWGAYHNDIYEETARKVREVGLDAKCLGGGRIHHNAAAKQLNVYGYSQGFGRADHEKTVQLLKKAYPDYEITWSNTAKVAMDDDTPIDFNALEVELQAAIEADERYWQQNDAKFRAVNQRVATYDEFRAIVNAAHLKPLEKGDGLGTNRKVIWNSLAPKKKEQLDKNSSEYSEQKAGQEQTDEDSLPKTSGMLENKWKTLHLNDRFNWLKDVGAEYIGLLLRSEIPGGLLGEMIQAVLMFQSDTSDVIFVVRLLEELSKAKRFNLSLQFLSSNEKAACEELLEKLKSSFHNRQQDLAEEGITEWTVLELKNKYKV